MKGRLNTVPKRLQKQQSGGSTKSSQPIKLKKKKSWNTFNKDPPKQVKPVYLKGPSQYEAEQRIKWQLEKQELQQKRIKAEKLRIQKQEQEEKERKQQLEQEKRQQITQRMQQRQQYIERRAKEYEEAEERMLQIKEHEQSLVYQRLQHQFEETEREEKQKYLQELQTVKMLRRVRPKDIIKGNMLQTMEQLRNSSRGSQRSLPPQGTKLPKLGHSTKRRRRLDITDRACSPIPWNETSGTSSLHVPTLQDRTFELGSSSDIIANAPPPTSNTNKKQPKIEEDISLEQFAKQQEEEEREYKDFAKQKESAKQRESQEPNILEDSNIADEKEENEIQNNEEQQEQEQEQEQEQLQPLSDTIEQQEVDVVNQEEDLDQNRERTTSDDTHIEELQQQDDEDDDKNGSDWDVQSKNEEVEGVEQ
eukprot:TRINITY_DN990_c0_g2_i6.p2 TRINITY_DN990_c0_g2~~TRINITY_DN990_c0_g2_i6.p2  ORF type:complete len:420 (+),score=67.90 TRINITY_DN990_c0_g2_i6:308-1567(+)